MLERRTSLEGTCVHQYGKLTLQTTSHAEASGWQGGALQWVGRKRLTYEMRPGTRLQDKIGTVCFEPAVLASGTTPREGWNTRGIRDMVPPAHWTVTGRPIAGQGVY